MQSHEYALSAIVRHIGGNGTIGSHYLTYILQSNEWLCCDDCDVTKVTKEDISLVNPYMLFYEKNPNFAVKNYGLLKTLKAPERVFTGVDEKNYNQRFKHT